MRFLVFLSLLGTPSHAFTPPKSLKTTTVLFEQSERPFFVKPDEDEVPPKLTPTIPPEWIDQTTQLAASVKETSQTMANQVTNQLQSIDWKELQSNAKEFAASDQVQAVQQVSTDALKAALKALQNMAQEALSSSKEDQATAQALLQNLNDRTVAADDDIQAILQEAEQAMALAEQVEEEEEVVEEEIVEEEIVAEQVEEEIVAEQVEEEVATIEEEEVVTEQVATIEEEVTEVATIEATEEEDVTNEEEPTIEATETPDDTAKEL